MNELSKLLRPMRLIAAYPDLKIALKLAQKHVIDGGTIDTDGWGADRLHVLQAAAWQAVHDDCLEKDRRLHKAEIPEVMLEFRRIAVFTKFGRQSFYFAADVVAELTQTSLQHLVPSDLRLPFSSFFVAFETPVKFDHDHEFEGFYCHSDAESIIVTICLRLPNVATPKWSLEGCFSVRATFADAVSVDQLIESSGEAYRKSLKHAEEVGHDQELADIYPDVLAALAKDLDFATESKVQIKAALELAFNCLFLLGAMPAEIVSPKAWIPPPTTRGSKVAKLEPGAAEVRTITFRSIAGSVGGSTSESLRRAHWRRGHWRRQAFGPVSEPMHRLRWIRPTLVSAANGGAAEATIYQVGP